MLITTDRREREDLSTVIDILKLKDDDMKYLSFVNFLPSIVKSFGKKVTAQKHEWLDDLARYDTFAAIASGGGADWDTVNDITDLPVVTAQITKLRVGDVLLLPTAGDEVVVVSAIDVAGQTIDLYSRGWGSTAGTAQGAGALTIKIIGNAQKEDSDPIGADFTPQTANYNYTQIFESVAAITGTLRRSRMAHNGDELSFQEVKKLKECLKELNYSILEGIMDLDATNHVATMKGLREFAGTTSNVAGALTVAKLYTAVAAHIAAGFYPSAIHGSALAIGEIEQLYLGAVNTSVSDRIGGTKIATVAILGYDVELHVDKHIRSAEMLIMDYNRVGYGPLDGGAEGQSGDFAIYPLMDKRHGKQFASQILGEFTLQVANGAVTRCYGIT